MEFFRESEDMSNRVINDGFGCNVKGNTADSLFFMMPK